MHIFQSVWVKLNSTKKLLFSADPHICNCKILSWSNKHLCSWGENVLTSEQKNLYSKENMIFPNVSSCNKLIFRKKSFCDKKILWGNSYLSHMGNLRFASPEEPIWRLSSIKYGVPIWRYSFRIAVLNNFQKFQKKHQQQRLNSA